MANPGLIQKETQKESLHPPKRVKENLLRTGARRVIKAKASERHSSCCTRCEDFYVTSEVTTLYVHRIAMLCPRGVYLNTSHNAHNSVVALSFPFLTDALIREESQPNSNLWPSVPQCTFQTPCNQVAPSSKSCSQLGSSCDKCAVVPTGGRVSPGKKHPKRARWAAEFPRLANGQIRSFCTRLQVCGSPQSCEAAK